MTDTYEQLGREIGALVDRKNRAYGSSFSKAGDLLRLLYPGGMRPEQYTNVLLLARMFDKMVRIATDQDAFGESPWNDLCGYAMLGSAGREVVNGTEEAEVGSTCGFVKEDVGTKSQAPSDSAERGASASTMPNANDRSGESSTTPSRPPSEPTSESTAVPAPTATASAWQNAVALGKIANDASCCATSIHPFAHSMLLPSKYQLCVYEDSKAAFLTFCSKHCCDLFLAVNR